jgi:peptidoglycan-N-acetylglucosamine deacetylase
MGAENQQFNITCIPHAPGESTILFPVEDDDLTPGLAWIRLNRTRMAACVRRSERGNMRSKLIVAGALFFGVVFSNALAPAARAAECPGNPDALGTSRVIVVDAAEHRRVGSMQYDETFPLEDGEVVLSFDDGPSAHYTPLVLDYLAHECVKATFFVVGFMASDTPALVRRAFDEGHTIGSHTQTHPLNMHRLPIRRAEEEIDQGVASVSSALGDPKAIAPFVRIPGLDRTRAIEAHAASRGLMVWSTDVDADDWTKISPEQVAARALRHLERLGKGVIELHDIHERTVQALPILFAQLKRRGYRLVHIAPAREGSPKTATAVKQWRF